MLLCVDAAEGCMVSTDKAIKAALAEGLPIALLLTKVSFSPLPCVNESGVWSPNVIGLIHQLFVLW